MAYELPDLPYDYAALEPHIDEQTMRIHHDKHHKAYVDNANAALQGTEWENRPVEQVLAELDRLPEDKQTPVRNNAGGHANHSLFWQIMGPDGGEPEGALATAIDDTFGSLDELKTLMNDTGVKRFGSARGLRRRAPSRDRRLGARLLPQVPEPTPGLPPGLLERGQLGRGGPPVRGRRQAAIDLLRKDAGRAELGPAPFRAVRSGYLRRFSFCVPLAPSRYPVPAWFTVR